MGQDFARYDMQQCIRAAFDPETNALKMIIVNDTIPTISSTVAKETIIEKIVEVPVETIVEKIVEVPVQIDNTEDFDKVYHAIDDTNNRIDYLKEDSQLKLKELGQSFSDALNNSFEKINKIEQVVNNQANVVMDLRTKNNKSNKENKIIKAVLLGSIILQLLILIF